MSDRKAALILAVAVLALCVYSRADAATRVGPASAYPPSSVTGATDPKATQANIHQTVCVAGYTQQVRAVAEA
ncbi:MAG: hypothetical protein KGL39_17000, partial [Patescibacteria group bacterium]|nr:hypothetical protein [Patescibacteria group bacterium]